jgi:hypothetical protein
MNILELTIDEFYDLYLKEVGRNIQGGCKCKIDIRIKRLEKTIGKKITIIK